MARNTFDTFGRFKATMLRIQDRATGLMPSFVYLDGRPRDVPRGCALSWSLAVLPDLDPEYAAEQWAAYRRGFARCAGGLCLFREYPAGLMRGPDADSGPIVGGLGMSASAFALAAARATGDMEMAESLRRAGELLGMPALSWWGKRYRRRANRALRRALGLDAHRADAGHGSRIDRLDTGARPRRRLGGPRGAGVPRVSPGARGAARRRGRDRAGSARSSSRRCWRSRCT